MDEISKMIELSICIPVYNGGTDLISCVSQILSYKGNNIEVVVSDNASEDGSIECLKKLEDDRLAIYVNEENIGPGPNWYRALMRGRGRYVMLLQDNDELVVENLPWYLDWLSRINYDIIKNVYANREHFSGEVTCSQMMYYGKVFSHGSYVAYRREAIQSIKPMKCSIDNAHPGYPYFIWDMQILEQYSVNAKKCFINGEIKIVNLKKKNLYSRTRKYSKYPPYTYDAAVKQFDLCAHILRELYKDDKDYSKMYCNLFRGDLMYATFFSYENLNSLESRIRYKIDVNPEDIDFVALNGTFLKHAIQELEINFGISKLIVNIKLHILTAKNRILFKLDHGYERSFKNSKYFFGCIENKILGWIINIIV